MSAVGQSRRFDLLSVTSALPRTSDVSGPGRHFEYGPLADIDRGSELPLHGASQSELRSQPIRCANADWHLAACNLALPKLSISPMRPQLQRAADRPLCNPGYTSSARRVLPLVFVNPCTGFKGDEPRAIPSRCDRWVGGQRYDFRRWTMDDPTPNRAIKNELGNARLFPRSRHCISRFHHFCS